MIIHNITMVPRLRASMRHGGEGCFHHISVIDSLRGRPVGGSGVYHIWYREILMLSKLCMEIIILGNPLSKPSFFWVLGDDPTISQKERQPKAASPRHPDQSNVFQFSSLTRGPTRRLDDPEREGYTRYIQSFFLIQIPFKHKIWFYNTDAQCIPMIISTEIETRKKRLTLTQTFHLQRLKGHGWNQRQPLTPLHGNFPA